MKRLPQHQTGGRPPGLPCRYQFRFKPVELEIVKAAARKAGVPLWRIGAVSVTTGLWATAQVLAGPVVTVHASDVHLSDLSRFPTPIPPV